MEIFTGKYGAEVRNLFPFHGHTALFHSTAAFGTGCHQPGFNQQIQNIDISIGKIRRHQLCSRHFRRISASEKSPCAFLRFGSFFLVMNQLGQFKCKDFLGLVQLAALPFVHLIDLLNRQEGEHTETFEHIRIRDISPVLVKFKG